MRTLYDGDEFEVGGHTFRVHVEADDAIGEPWKEFDGHGLITEWTRRSKAPGERVLAEDRGAFRYYDVQETMKVARKDGWGCSHGSRQPDGTWSHGHRTQREATACAVEQDYDRMRAWCNGDWTYVVVTVTLLDEDGRDTEHSASTGGVESDGDIADVAQELAEEIIGRIEVEHPDVVLSEN